jgi:branched-chain amino acid transport system permease protein
LPSFRIRGLYLAVSTLAFGIAAERYLFRLNAISGGTEGLALPLYRTRDVLALALLLLAGAVILAGRVTRSRAGWALFVLHFDETMAESWGIATHRFKLFAFGLSGFLAGCAGVVYATLIGHITSEAFTIELAVTLVAMAIVGGLGSVPGVVAGAVFFAVLPELLSGATLYLPLAYATTLLAVILFLPRGLAQLWRTA